MLKITICAAQKKAHRNPELVNSDYETYRAASIFERPVSSYQENYLPEADNQACPTILWAYP